MSENIKIRLIRLNTKNCKVMANERSVAKMPCKNAQNHGLNDGTDLSQEDFQDIVDNVLVPEAINLATAWLARRETSRLEISQKLRQRGFSQDIIDKAIERLREYGYVDDRRFAMALVDLRQNNQPYGRIRLAADLRAKGITGEAADTALMEFNEEEAIKLAAEMGRRRGLEGQKMYNFLYRRGFSSQLIQKVIRMDTSD